MRRVLLSAACIALMVAIVGQFSANSGHATAPCASPTSQYVSLTVENPDGTVFSVQQIPWIQNENVHLAMLNAQSVNSSFSFQTGYFCPYGGFVNTINGLTEGGNQYWALYVNGNFAQMGIDTYLLNPGDKITWKVQDASAHTDTQKDTHQAKMVADRIGRRLDAKATGK